MGKCYNKVILIFLFLTCISFAQTQKNISGYVVDSLSSGPIIGAYIANKTSNLYTVTNQSGWFSIAAADNDTISISFIGYKAKTLKISEILAGNNVVYIGLEEKPIVIGEIQVTAKLKKEKMLTQTGYLYFSAKAVKYLPTVGGESDITKILQLLPGVSTSNEGSARFNVRGGDQDQNLMLLDGVQIYNPIHLLGYFSSFNTDAINSVEFYKGYIPPEYSEKLSSVININLKRGNPKKLKMSAGISLLSSQFMIDGPLGKNASIMISARRTYLDLINSLAEITSFNYSYSDIYSKLTFNLSPSDHLFFSSYYGTDHYTENQQSLDDNTNKNTKWGNYAAHLRYNRVWNSSFFSDISLVYSRYFSEYKRGAIAKNPGITEFTLKNKNDYNVSKILNLKFGGDLRYYKFDVTSDLLNSNTSVYNLDAFETNLFSNAKLKFTNYLEANLGVNISTFNVKKYDGKYSFIDPRISINYLINDATAIKLSYTGTHQYVHTLSSTKFYAPNDIFYPANKNLKPINGNETSLGLTKIFSLNTSEYEFSLDLYYRDMKDVSQFKLNYYDADPDRLNEQLFVGKGWAYGVEMQLSKREGRLYGWINYTWNKVYRQIDGKNFSHRFVPSFNRVHQLNLVLNYNVSRKLVLGATFVLASGLPISLPVNKYIVFSYSNEAVSRVIDYDEYNKYRLPLYNRLDLSMVYKSTLFGLKSELSVSIYNVYNYQNPTFLTFNKWNGNFKSRTVGILPTAGIKFFF